MNSNRKKMAIATVAGAGLVWAASAQAQVTISTPITPRVYGQIVIGDNPPPPLRAPAPVLVQPVAAVAPPPVYLYVPDRHRVHWAQYCHYYQACARPVYFVDASDPRVRGLRPVYRVVQPGYVMPPGRVVAWRQPRWHDHGWHEGWQHRHGGFHRD